MSKHKNKGVEIAKLLWPELALEPKGSFWDHYGIDAHLNGNTVQIKYDHRIAESNNIYHEIYEKTALRPDQPWRKSPGIATHYIFTTEDRIRFIGILIPVDVLAKVETDKKLTAISPNQGFKTSLGFLIPYSEIEGADEKRIKIKTNLGA